MLSGTLHYSHTGQMRGSCAVPAKNLAYKCLKFPKLFKANLIQRRTNLKTAFLSRKRIKCSPPTLSLSNCFAVHIETLLTRDCDRDSIVVVTSRFQKVPFSLVFAVHTNTPSRRFQIIHFGECFQKVPVSVTENAVLVWTEPLFGRKKVAFSNLSGLVWT